MSAPAARAPWTAGPWAFRHNAIVAFNEPCPSYQGQFIRIADIPDHEDTEQRANAQLISAAPDLAAALEAIIANAVLISDRLMQGATDIYTVPLDDIDAARAALAKAREDG